MPLTLRRDLTRDEIRALRASQGWTQPEMAEVLHVGRNAIYRAEAGVMSHLLSTAVYLLWCVLDAAASADGGPGARVPPPLPREST